MKQERSFKTRVSEVVSDIPMGEVLSYTEVARRAGNPAAARAVGMIMSKNHDPKIPCHRVICSTGKLGGYNGGVNKKRALLEKERYKV
ncbi:MGMT family protein [Patescibacteria group bacterium]|nr:MGMT family protein [Patescibacteria group bacterium]MCH8889000.1 MGMT family protein [Patescibacteria group bacterium]